MAGYVYYLRDKNEQLKIIEKGECPRCRSKSIVLSDQRGGGCGPKLLTYRCLECGYQNSFSVEGGSCGL
ncbi:hypothetical protein [Nitratifractor sp.]